MYEVPPTAGLPLTWGDLLADSAPLENGLAAFVGAASIQIECSASAALVVALTALKNSSPRRQVVIPAYTCPLVAWAVLQAGLVPVACDTRSGHFDLCPDALQASCNEFTLAVIPTHLGGRLADMANIAGIAKKAGAYVVEDAAQALGAMWQGRPAGSMGDIGIYSLGVGKGLTIYGGGALVAGDETLREQLKATSEAIVSKNMRREVKRALELVGYTALYRPIALTFAYGMPLRRHLQGGRLLAAVGDIHPHNIPLHRVGNWRKQVGARALQRLSWFQAQTRAQAARRKSRLQGIRGVEVLDDEAGNSGTWPVLMLMMPSQQARDKALQTLWPAGLGVGRMFIHALPDYPDLSAHFVSADTPNARDFAARMLTISNSLWLKDDRFEAICNVIEASLG